MLKVDTLLWPDAPGRAVHSPRAECPAATLEFRVHSGTGSGPIV